MFGLTTDFEAAGRGLRDLSARMRQKSFSLERDFPFPAQSLLPVKAWKWNTTRKGDSRCYNYALDLVTNDNLVVGDIHLAANPHPGNESLVNQRDHSSMGFSEWTALIQQYAEKDGLIPLGDDFRNRAGGYPVALFFHPMKDEDEMDYHFYSLRMGKTFWAGRENPVWAHHLHYFAKQCRLSVFEKNDLTMVFTKATHHGYDHFGGFYEVTPAVKERALGVLPPEFVNVPKFRFSLIEPG